jgi:hypothetical protein
MSPINRICTLLVLSVIWASQVFSRVSAADVVLQMGHAPGTTVAYSIKHPEQHIVLLKSTQGVIYRLSLVPDSDNGKHVVVMDLVLARSDKKASVYDSNLLEPKGMWHGYEPFIFAAHDYVRGAQKSIYGATRVMRLQDLGTEMRVKVFAVHVVPVPGSSFPDGGPDYQFQDLRLVISTRALSD